MGELVADAARISSPAKTASAPYSLPDWLLPRNQTHPRTAPVFSRSIPYPLSNVSNILQMKLRQDYYQLEWPMQTRQYQYGVYADGVLQNYFPPAFGIIRNIANG